MGAFGGFAGGLGSGLLQQENDQDQNKPQNGSQNSGQQGSGGLFGILKNAISPPPQKGSNPPAAPTPPATMAVPGQASPTAPASAPAAAAPAQQQQPINTQTQQPAGFHGIAPMVQGYIQNHQAKAQDAVAQTHMSALQDPSTTPEQRQYHINSLQQVYANRPDVLKQLGIGGPNVPNVQTAAPAPAAATPAGGQ